MNVVLDYIASSILFIVLGITCVYIFQKIYQYRTTTKITLHQYIIYLHFCSGNMITVGEYDEGEMADAKEKALAEYESLIASKKMKMLLQYETTDDDDTKSTETYDMNLVERIELYTTWYEKRV